LILKASRPFFCQIEAVETVIWLTEAAPKAGKAGSMFLSRPRFNEKIRLVLWKVREKYREKRWG